MSDRAVMPLEDYVAACDKVREKTGSTDLIKSGELPEKVDEVYEKGKDAEWNEFWDDFQQNNARRDYSMGFAGGGWKPDIFKPKYDIISTRSDYMFNYTTQLAIDLAQTLDDLGIIFDTSQSRFFQNMFCYSAITRIGVLDLTNAESASNMFVGSKIKTIDKIILNTNGLQSLSNTFYAAENLEEIRFEGIIGQNGLDLSPSTSLTKDSLMNVINCLMAYTVADELVLPNTSGSAVLSNAKLIEGKNYLMEFRSYEFNGASSPLYVGSQNLTASKVNIEGVGERIGVWQECDFWADPDIYWYRVCVYQDGDDIKESRCMVDKQTGEVIPHAYEGDILTLKVDQTETHSVTLGEANLAKLTDAEKAIATQKGWVLN